MTLQQLRNRSIQKVSSIHHRCSGYRKEEIVLTPRVQESVIVSYTAPFLNEICSICGECVQEELFFCVCGLADDGLSPIKRCSICYTWGHQACEPFKSGSGRPICNLCSNLHKSKKGLNPDAQVFDMSRKPLAHKTVPPSTSVPNAPVYDALNSNGLVSLVPSDMSDGSTLLRAFAPTPAEREILQRPLGGPTNGSLKRLPSDVWGITPSSGDAGIPRALPAWLQTFQSLPRIRKSNFNPWADEEPF
ncbi:hypothetical protein K435DRAFT_62545 [Dendrothele bispora CBS 962.96]|uniref:Zinc finger PHD-type domain-containing protein n=1 Tax=Dendrothele bispora (strain CBS 962.96) TaxID=1314807 RepID=A0A4V4HG53_DENBC|nr:hypothetical protein K435DRAFT_62545 [Dendrothele bispora CBS 962.96]